MQFKRYLALPAVALGLMATACGGSEPATSTIDGVPMPTEAEYSEHFKACMERSSMDRFEHPTADTWVGYTAAGDRLTLVKDPDTGSVRVDGTTNNNIDTTKSLSDCLVGKDQEAEPVATGHYTELEMATLLEAGDWGNDFAPAVVDNVICSQQSDDKFICDGDYIDGETTPAKWEVTATDNGQWLASPVVE